MLCCVVLSLHTSINLLDVIFVLVVPTALMISNREQLGQGRDASQESVLREYVLGSRTHQEVSFDDTSLADPVSVLALLKKSPVNTTHSQNIHNKE